MNKLATLVAIDRVQVEGSRRCTKCDRAKPISYFNWLPSSARYHSWCRQCVRIGIGLSYEDPDVRAVRAAYEATPRRKELRRIVAARRDPEKQRRNKAAWGSSPRGRVCDRLGKARRRLRLATTDEQRARIQALIDRHTAALAALNAEDD